MVIVPSASSEADPQARSQNEVKDLPEITTTDTGIELEAALPVAVATDISEAEPRTSEAGDKPAPSSKLEEAAESSASHLAGSSALDIE
jgi:GTP diphosphokinase / guanosine-3',5'-bis(diphosphate) 3'-diphosphatase